MLQLTKRVFRAARDALETLGQVPDRLEREELARLVVPIDNVIGDLAPPPSSRRFEAIDVSVAAVAARFSTIILVSPYGFWIEQCTTLTPVSTLFGALSAAPSLAGSTAAVTITRAWEGERIPADWLSVTGGDAAAATTLMRQQVSANSAWVTHQRRLWVAPGVFFVLQSAANAATDATLRIAVARDA